MPSKNRRARARQLKDMDEAILAAPPHVKCRDADTSPVAKALTISKLYNYRGIQFDEHGNLKSLPHGSKSSNDARRAEADAKCELLVHKYGKKWGERRFIKEIAETEKVCTRTVERYFARCPK